MTSPATVLALPARCPECRDLIPEDESLVLVPDPRRRDLRNMPVCFSCALKFSYAGELSAGLGCLRRDPVAISARTRWADVAVLIEGWDR